MKLLFVKFPFGTEMGMSQQNHVGDWNGISWDPSQQNPTRTCSTKLPPPPPLPDVVSYDEMCPTVIPESK